MDISQAFNVNIKLKDYEGKTLWESWKDKSKKVTEGSEMKIVNHDTMKKVSINLYDDEI